MVAGTPWPSHIRQKLDNAALSTFLAQSGWEAWEDTLPREDPFAHQELIKNFVFDSFLQAAEFMHRAAALFESEQHHPRWSNEWRLVTIRLTTWDARNRITEVDLKLAAKIDEFYRSFCKECARSARA